LFAARNGRSAKADGEMLAYKIGVSPAIERAQLEERDVWYRARISGYDTFSSALKTAKRFLLAGLIKDYWIVPSDDWSKRSGSE